LTIDSFLFYDSCIDNQEINKKPRKPPKNRNSGKNESETKNLTQEFVNTKSDLDFWFQSKERGEPHHAKEYKRNYENEKRDCLKM